MSPAKESADLSVRSLKGGLVVSCQAMDGTPLRDSRIMARIAKAALMGGAVGLRLNGPEDIRAVREFTDAPIIGLYKVPGPARPIITPDFQKAQELAQAGADIIAVDLSGEHGIDPSLIGHIKDQLGVSVMADIATVAEAQLAWQHGADLVGTTLAGYTPETKSDEQEPDLQLVRQLSSLGMTVIAEGRYRTPEQVSQAFEAGAFSVVVGGAITDPLKTTALFAQAAPRR